MITPLLPRLKEAGDTLEVNKAIIELARQANIPDQANTAQIAINTAAIAQNTAGIAYGDAYHWQHNYIINGDMAIAQRGTAELTLTGTVQYPVDRFGLGSTAGTIKAVQSTTVPAGFINSIKVTVTTHYHPSAGQITYLQQLVEGTFISSLDYGLSTAKTLTLSFWVRSSIIGNYGGCLSNNASNRSYPFAYTIIQANTWEKKTITIPGDVTPTWLTTSGVGFRIFWGLGIGTNYRGTAGAWAASGLIDNNDSIDFCAQADTSTWYITGIMLNEGSVAAPFRLCGGTPAQEELLCQRYLPCMNGDDINDRLGLVGFCFTTDDCMIEWEFKIVARAAPTSIVATITDFYINTNTGAAVNIDAIALAGPSRFGVGLNVDVAGTPLVAGDGTTLVCLTAGAKMYLNGCEL